MGITTATEAFEEFSALIDLPYKTSLANGEDLSLNENLKPEFTENSRNKDKLYPELATCVRKMWEVLQLARYAQTEKNYGLLDEGVYSYTKRGIIDMSTYPSREDLDDRLDRKKNALDLICDVTIKISTALLNALGIAQAKASFETQDPGEDSFSLADNLINISNAPNHRINGEKIDIYRLINQGINTALTIYRNFAILGFEVAKMNKDKFPDMNQEEFENLMKSMLKFPLKVISKHNSALAQVKSISNGEMYNGVLTLGTNYFDLDKGPKGYFIKLNYSGKEKLKTNAEDLRRQKMYAKKIGCPIQLAQAAITKSFHNWISDIYIDLVIPRLWNHFNRSEEEAN